MVKPPAAPGKKANTLLIQKMTGNPVQVKLINGVVLRGVFKCIDGYFNVALDEVLEEHKTPSGEVTSRALGEMFLRGNNGKS